MTLRNCQHTRCPLLIPAGQRYCQQHKREHDRQRGTTTQRGYGTAHRRLREQWARRIQAGDTPTCPRCGRAITSDDKWQLGHNDKRDGWTGPEHAACNERAGQTNSIRMREHWNG